MRRYQVAILFDEVPGDFREILERLKSHDLTLIHAPEQENLRAVFTTNSELSDAEREDLKREIRAQLDGDLSLALSWGSFPSDHDTPI